MQESVSTVSVVIPTFNRAHVVDQAIGSVLGQTYQNLEVIVVDDASTDHTEEVVKAFGDSRVHYFRHEQNRGAPWARNSGAEVARGEYFAFLDSDDRWFPELLERQLAALIEFSPAVGMICCGMIRTDGESRRVVIPAARSLTFDGNLIDGVGICTSSFLVRRAAFQNIGGFDVRFSSFQDFDFLLRIAREYRIEAIDDVLLEYRVGEDSISVDMVSKAKGFQRIINTYRSDILRLGLMNRYLFRLGQYFVLSGRLGIGWRWWLRALQYRPLDTKIWKHLLLTLAGAQLYIRILDLHRRLGATR